MARSPAHQFGQLIGDALEEATLPVLAEFAQAHRLYLDKKGLRPCRTGVKCTWTDASGNAHDLDFVLERGGTDDAIGTPVAFIETAWRRYTKHSRNKAQEIQGAIDPLAETHRSVRPFKGAVLAGVFTDGAVQQLRSLGYSLLYFPYEYVIDVFRRFDVDAESDERTPDVEFRRRIKSYRRLSDSARTALHSALVDGRRDDVNEFLEALRASIVRKVVSVIVWALHGQPHEAANVADAINYVEGYARHGHAAPVARYEIIVRYSNEDTIQGTFADKRTAIEFLRGYLPAT